MRFFIFDPALQDFVGHPFNCDNVLLSEMERRGVENFVFGNMLALSEVEDGFAGRFHRLFYDPFYHHVGLDSLTWVFEDFLTIGTQFCRDLQRIQGLTYRPDDVVFFPNVWQNQIYGINLWLQELPQGQRPQVAVLLRFLNHQLPYLDGRQNIAMIPLLYRYACQALLATHSGAHLFTESEALKTEYEAITDRPLEMLPLPMLPFAANATAPVKKGGSFNVVYAGYPGPMKGFNLLPDIIQHCLSMSDDIRFTIQAKDLPYAAASRGRLETLEGERVSLVRDALSQEQYRDLLTSADIVLLPYSPEGYGPITSGVFVEALSSGKIVVIPPRTWMSAQLEKWNGGGEMFDEWAPEPIARAIVRASLNFTALSRKAVAAADDWGRHHGAERFVNLLLEKLHLHLQV